MARPGLGRVVRVVLLSAGIALCVLALIDVAYPGGVRGLAGVRNTAEGNDPWRDDWGIDGNNSDTRGPRAHGRDHAQARDPDAPNFDVEPPMDGNRSAYRPPPHAGRSPARPPRRADPSQGSGLGDLARALLGMGPRDVDARHADDWRDDPVTEETPNSPGRAARAGPASAAVHRIAWDGYTSRITIRPDGSALIETSLVNGRQVVSYPATAYVDAAGNTHLDARNAPVSGPWSTQWSPDSFRIDPYGSVSTLDDQPKARGGWVSQTTPYQGAPRP